MDTTSPDPRGLYVLALAAMLTAALLWLIW